MNGLVGYDSESEDEDVPSAAQGSTFSKPPAQPNASKDKHHQDSPLNVNVSESLNGIQGPMVGPSRATEANVESYDEAMPDELPDMPESDLLRYLTQPSHPMTLLPAAPESNADPAVTAKFRRFLELKGKGIHFNQDLAAKSSFKNPRLFSTLLERASLPSEAQYSSTLPKSVFDIDDLPAWAYKEGLLKRQQQILAQEEANKKVQSASGRRTIEFTPGSNSVDLSQDNQGNKRKQPG